MYIVATGMHHPIICRLIIYLILFGNRQGIHVGTQRNNLFIRIPPFYFTYYAGFDIPAFIWDPVFIQPGFNKCRSLKFAERKFRILVYVPANVNYIVKKFLCKLCDCFFRYGHEFMFYAFATNLECRNSLFTFFLSIIPIFYDCNIPGFPHFPAKRLCCDHLYSG